MNAVTSANNTPHYRAVFISDTHLGTRGCRSDFLADFLSRMSCDKLFLVGDIVDGWRLRKSWYWDPMHDKVIRTILRHVRDGTQITYIPGNHDEMFRPWLPAAMEAGTTAQGFHIPGGLEVAGITVQREAEHTTAKGQRMLIIHGDEFDGVMRYAKFLAILGDSAYTAALVLNRWFNVGRRWAGYPYWSLSQWLKQQVKGAVKAIDRFETALADEARRRGFDGVICGHIHHAEMRMVNGVLYCNDGDWVESCTALVEHHDGRLELVDWAAVNRLSFFSPRRTTLAASVATDTAEAEPA
jgi:UDP-2,3-diacylglucosamine pyrophosphatase LpxH